MEEECKFTWNEHWDAEGGSVSSYWDNEDSMEARSVQIKKKKLTA